MAKVKREDLAAFGKRLRQARCDRDMSQPELAQRIGKSKQLVSAWETGRAEITTTTLIQVIRALDVDSDWLLFGVGQDHGGLFGLQSGSLVPFFGHDQLIKQATEGIEADAASARAHCYFPLPDGAFAIPAPDAGMDEGPGAIARGEILFVAPTARPNPGDVVVAVVKRAGGVALEEPLLAVRQVRYTSAAVGSPPFDLVPASPAWPTLAVQSSSDASVLGTLTATLRPYRT